MEVCRHSNQPNPPLQTTVAAFVAVIGNPTIKPVDPALAPLTAIYGKVLKMRCVIYARYSTDKQTDDSIAAQVRACTAYAAAHGHVIVGEYTDEAVSGKGSKTAARTQYQRLLRDCGKFDTILIHKYDRVSRNLGEHVNLEKKLHDKGVTLIAVAQDFGLTNEGKFVRSIVWAMSEYFLDNLSDEVKKGHRETALKGLHNGGFAPFGYEVIDQRYVINDLEAGFVRKMFDAAENRRGFVELIAEMNAAGIRGKRGRPISYTSIYEILHNEKYIGTYVYRPEETPGRVARLKKPNAIRIENALPAIVDKAQFERVQKIMSERKQTGKTKSGYLCSGLVYCGCGAKMHGSQSSRNGNTYAYYVCSAKCGNPNIPVETVDKAVTEYLNELLSPENEAKISAVVHDYQSSGKRREEIFMDALQAKIDDKQRQYDNLVDNLSAGALPPDVLEDIGNKMQQLKDEMGTLRNVEPPKDFAPEYITGWLESLRTAPDEKAIQLLIERIDVQNKTDFNITSTLKSVLGDDWLRN